MSHENWLFQATQTIQTVLPGYAICFRMNEDNKFGGEVGAMPTSKLVDANPNGVFPRYYVSCTGTDKDSVMEAMPRLIGAIKTGAEAA